MHPDAAEKLGRYLKRIEELEKNGIDVYAAIPRFFWAGHRSLHIIAPEKDKWKCVACNIDWETKHSYRNSRIIECPSCKSKYYDPFDFDLSKDASEIVVFCLTRETAKWECVECQHTWEGENGTICPTCKAVRK